MSNDSSDQNHAPSATTRGGRAPAPTIYPDGLSRWRDLAPRIPYTREGWRYRINNGTAPKPATGSRHFTAWRGSDILAWLRNPDGYNADEMQITQIKE